MEHGMSLQSLLIITTLAFIIPLALAKMPKLSIPIVVGEILAGMMIGKSGFNLIDLENESLLFLSSFGFTYLMFLSGLEIDVSHMSSGNGKKGFKEWMRGPVGLASLSFVLTLGLATTIAYGLYTAGIVKSFLLMALILSTTSLGVVVPIIKERKMSVTELGQTILLSALIADFVTMVLITLVASLIDGGQIANMLLILILFVAFFLLYRLGLLLSRMDVIEKLAHATSQIRVRAAFALILVFVALAQQLGSEVILGAFLAGLIISMLSKHHGHELHMKLDAIGYGFFIPIFFIMVGVQFDIQAIQESANALVLIPILVLSAYFVKVVPALIFRIRYSMRETLSAGFLLSSRLSLIIAASQIGLSLGVISQAVNSSIILVAIITVTISPMVYQKIAPKPAEKEEKVIVVIGMSQVGVFLVNRLRKMYDNIIHLTIEENAVGLIKESKIKRLPQDSKTVTKALVDVGIKEADTVVICTNNEEYNYEVSVQLEKDFHYKNIYTVLNDEEAMKRLQDMGVNVVTPSMATELVLENLIRNPQTFSLLTEEREARKIAEIEIRSPRWIGSRIRELDLPESILILSIVRGQDIIVPHGSTQIQEGDTLTIMGSTDEVNREVQLLTTF
jgi:Kef-type K+ transport system membrane component KefB/Trk K+ transport system NAD-binding subunit